MGESAHGPSDFLHKTQIGDYSGTTTEALVFVAASEPALAGEARLNDLWTQERAALRRHRTGVSYEPAFYG